MNAPVRGEEHVRVHQLGVQPARLVGIVVHDRYHEPVFSQEFPEHGYVVVQPQESPVIVPLVDHELSPTATVATPAAAAAVSLGERVAPRGTAPEGRSSGGREGGFGNTSRIETPQKGRAHGAVLKGRASRKSVETRS